MINSFMQFSIRRPKVIMAITLLMVIGALLQFPKISVDTDPENMLPEDAPVRVFHRAMKKEFALYDLIVIGIVGGSRRRLIPASGSRAAGSDPMSAQMRNDATNRRRSSLVLLPGGEPPEWC